MIDTLSSDYSVRAKPCQMSASALDSCNTLFAHPGHWHFMLAPGLLKKARLINPYTLLVALVTSTVIHHSLETTLQFQESPHCLLL